MFFSLISLAIFLWFVLIPHGITLSAEAQPHVSLMIAAGGTAFLLIVPIINALFLGPFQRAEQNLTPRVMETISQDLPLIWGNIFLFAFPFLCYLLVAALFLFDNVSKVLLVAVWALAFGISLDILRGVIKRSMKFLNPFKIVERFVHAAKESIKNNKDSETWQWMDALADVAMKAIEKHSSTLLSDALNGLSQVFRTFLDSCKSITHPSQDQGVEAATGRDEVSYTLYYVVNRMEMIFSKAMSKQLEPLCSQTIATLGKMTVSAAKLDLSLATFPTQILGKLTVRAQENNLDDVAVKSSGVLLEVAKSILTQIDITYMELKDPFVAIVCALENIAKMSFKKDKTISIRILIEPLKALQAIFQEEKYASHPDTPAILSEINRVLQEFATLEEVLRALPTIPKEELKAQS